MARLGYEIEQPKWHKRSFRDHTGCKAIRVRRSVSADTIPEDFKQRPLFPIQVYTTFPLQTPLSIPEVYEEAAEQSTSKRTRGDADDDVSMTPDLEQLIQSLGDGLSGAQRPAPIWEIYEPQVDVFACVEHQRREIAYRMSTRADSHTLPIPLIAENSTGTSRKTGFCIVVDSPFFKQCYSKFDDEDYDANGPLWMRFYRPSCPPQPSAGANESLVERAARRGTAEDTELGSVVEIEAERKQMVVRMRRELEGMYFSSCYATESEEKDRALTYLDLGRDDEEVMSTKDNHNPSSTPKSKDLITAMAGELSLDKFKLTRTDSKLTVTSGEGEPHIQYAVAVLLSTADRDRLEQVAKAFTRAISTHLEEKSVSFTFYSPSEPYQGGRRFYASN